MLKSEMGARIEKLRENQKMTREELAERTGISTKFLYEVERGKKGISAQTLLRIAKALSASCDYILTGDEKMEMNNLYVRSEWKKFNEKQHNKLVEIIDLIYELYIEK